MSPSVALHGPDAVTTGHQSLNPYKPLRTEPRNSHPIAPIPTPCKKPHTKNSGSSGLSELTIFWFVGGESCLVSAVKARDSVDSGMVVSLPTVLVSGTKTFTLAQPEIRNASISTDTDSFFNLIAPHFIKGHRQSPV